MTLKEFLEDTPILKGSILAGEMWPGKKHAAKVFSNKINEVVAGNGIQRITESDEELAKEVLLKLADKIKAFAKSKQSKKS